MTPVDPLLCVSSLSFQTSIAVGLHTSKDEGGTYCLHVLTHRPASHVTVPHRFLRILGNTGNPC